MNKRKNHLILTGYISKEFAQDFLVAFVFFFCIFFINSILLLVQRILLKNISFSTMIEMVLLNMPQFMVYVFPFATLTASSMVLGDLSSSNELLAVRSCGIPSIYIYWPLIFISILMSIITFVFADVIHPWSSNVYKDRLSVLMAEMPTFEIESNNVNTVGNIILYNGNTEGRIIEDLVLISNDDKEQMNSFVKSERGTLDLIDPVYYVYALSLDRPDVFLNDRDDIESFGLSNSERATFYLDFSEQIPSLTSNSPVNLTSKELIDSIEIRDLVQKEDREEWKDRREESLLEISQALVALDRNTVDEESALRDVNSALFSYTILGEKPVNFYGQYYKAELTKKFVLSVACFFLTLVSLPLSNVRVKHGKLTGFAISLLLAVAFWYMLFGAQLFIFDISFSPYILMMAPDLIMLSLALVLFFIYRKAR